MPRVDRPDPIAEFAQGAYPVRTNPLTGLPRPWSEATRRAGATNRDAAAALGFEPLTPTDAAGLNAYVEQLRQWMLYLDDATGLYGDASDGDVTLGAGTTTLYRDRYYETLIVPSGATLDTNGYRVFARTLIQVNAGGAIRCDGNAGATSGAGGAGGAATNTGTLVGGSAGGDGANTTGDGTAGGNVTRGLGGAGGLGGTAGGGNDGGSGGAVTRASSANGGGTAAIWPGHVTSAITGRDLAGQQLAGGSGGGGGGANAVTGTSGGGGSGGGFMILAAKRIVNNGTISAVGGAGGAATGAGHSGGAGGGGGAIELIRRDETGSGIVTVAGGALGVGSSGASSGLAAGDDGNVYRYTA